MPGMQLREVAPDFELPDVDGVMHRLSNYRGRIAVINFWSCECPHAERTDRSLMAMSVQWGEQVALLPVAANAIETDAAIAAAAFARHLPLVLLDRSHAVADLYDARTTPHVFVVDSRGILRYRGAVDDVNFGQRRPTRFYLEEAVEALLDGREPELNETPAYGCSIVREALE